MGPNHPRSASVLASAALTGFWFLMYEVIATILERLLPASAMHEMQERSNR